MYRNKRIICAAAMLLTAVLTAVSLPQSTQAAESTEKGSLLYPFSLGGSPVSTWQEINGKSYYFDANGQLAVGWQKIDGTWYYLGADGAKKTGWQKVKGAWYYLDETGAMVTGWQEIDGSWYYLDTSGAMSVGWRQIDGSWYYFHTDGHMAAGEWISSLWVDTDGVYDKTKTKPVSLSLENTDLATIKANVCETAESLIGSPVDQYIWGGNGPQDGGVDCSGILMYAFTQNGYAFDADYNANAFAEHGQEISRDELEPGDVIVTCYNAATGRYTHILLYIGDDMVVASECGGPTVCSLGLACDQHDRGTVCNCGINKRPINDNDLINAKFVRMDAYLQ